ncbi:MAG: lipopolysaccharide biosynthesis protein [Nocardioides sp.]
MSVGTLPSGPRHSAVRPSPIGRARAVLDDPVVGNALIMVLTTLLMAGAGTLFWIVVARLAQPAEVGVASTLVSAAEALAFFAQLGLNVSLLRSMSHSTRPASDVATAGLIVALAGVALALAYAALVPSLSPGVARALGWTAAPVFALLVAATAVNQLTDSLFLAVDRVRANLWVNGVLTGGVRMALPFTLAGAGAFHIFGVLGATSVLAAGASVAVILRRLPDRPSLRPSPGFGSARGLAASGYVVNGLLITPQLVLPLVVINTMGAALNAVFFISFQVANLLNHAVYTVGNAMYAEAERNTAEQRAITQRGARTMTAAVVLGAGVVVLAAPLLLAVFGAQYADSGVGALRLLALGASGVGLNYWAAMRLRLIATGRAMVLAQLISTGLTLTGVAWGAQHGLTGVALGWWLGQSAGGAISLLLTRLAHATTYDKEVHG